LSGKPLEAMAAARRASRRLRGSGLFWEALNHQLLAVLQLNEQPRTALRSMRQAVRAASDPVLLCQARFNLATMLARLGRLADSIACAAAGLREASGRARPERILDFRIHLLSGRAALGRIEEAKEEALALVRLPSVQRSIQRHYAVRYRLGLCLLHEGQVARAVQIFLDNWQRTTYAALKIDGLCLLIDALLDSDDWDVVKNHAADLIADSGSGTPEAVAALARGHAIVATANGDDTAAWEHLRPALPVARGLSAWLDASGFFYHSAVALSRIATGRDGRERFLEAVALIDECLEALPAGAYGHHRVRAMTQQAEALRLAGQVEASNRRLDEAIALARRVRCRRWLARGLELRMVWESEDA